jgi:hypothetical protein
MMHMGACLVCQAHELGHDSVSTLISVSSWESMLDSLDPGELEVYSRNNIIGMLLEHGTKQETNWVGREVEFSYHV